jgi:hypothetical protein
MNADTKRVIESAVKRAIQGGVVGSAMGLVFHGVASVPAGWFLGIPYGHALVYFPFTIAGFGITGATIGGIAGGWIKHKKTQRIHQMFAQKVSSNE